MALNIHFSNHGNQIEVTRADFPTRVESNEAYEDRNLLGRATILRCLLLSRCSEMCEHRESETIQITLNDEEEAWFAEQLILTLRCSNDLKQRLRAITILGMIGGSQARIELAHFLGNSCPDLHWAAVSSLKRIGCGDLLAEWNYR